MPMTAFQPFGESVLGAADEVAGRVVHEEVDAAARIDRARHHRVDLVADARTSTSETAIASLPAWPKRRERRRRGVA